MLKGEARKAYDRERSAKRAAQQREKRRLADLQRKSKLAPITDPFCARLNGGAGRLRPGEVPAPIESEESRHARFAAVRAQDEAAARFNQQVEDEMRRRDPVAWAEYRVMVKQSQPGVLAALDHEFNLQYAEGTFNEDAGTPQGDPDFQSFLNMALAMNAKEQAVGA